MTLLTNPPKHVVLELCINESRDTVRLAEQVAKVLDVDIGERENHEWIRLVHLRHINKENLSAR